MAWTISGQCPSMNWTKCRSSGLYHLIHVLDAFLFSVVQNVIDSSIVIVGDTILFETGNWTQLDKRLVGTAKTIYTSWWTDGFRSLTNCNLPLFFGSLTISHWRDISNIFCPLRRGS